MLDAVADSMNLRYVRSAADQGPAPAKLRLQESATILVFFFLGRGGPSERTHNPAQSHGANEHIIIP